jgi:uncharacterized protein (TIRG00374 family)
VKLAINLTLSLTVLALFVWLAWPSGHQQQQLEDTLRGLRFAEFWPYVTGYVALLGVTHFFRAWRWKNLLSPMGIEIPTRRLLAISSVGFMAILALPARLGEFARPALLRKKGHVSATAVLGTVAVERIVDGLMVSLMVFVCFFARRGPDAPGWMMPTAYASLGIFLAAMLFLVFALKWPDATIKLCLHLSLLPRFAPRVAQKIDELLRKLISGFLALKDGRNLALFALWSAVYWGANGFSMWLLARGFGMDLSVVGAFATMGVIAVGITLPNSPGLVGQFHFLTLKGLSLYLPATVVGTSGLAYAILLHGLQVIWYLGVGGLCMLGTNVHWAEVLGRDTSEEPAA